MLGFTLPLFIIMGLEGLVGVLLLCPKPVNQPAIQLARASYTQIGSTIFHTLAGVLLLLLVSPIYDGARIYYSTKDKSEQVALDLSEHEARTLLSGTLTASCLAMMFFIRKLGRVLGDLERQSISEAALLKQVQGLQSEYTRMVDSGGAAAGKTATAAAPSGPSAAGAAGTAGSAGAAGSAGLSPEEVGTLRKLVADLEAQNSKLQAAKEKTEQEHAAAEANLSALKTQARGLENEYDRLLAENDQLKTRLARAGLGEPVAAGGFAKKDE